MKLLRVAVEDRLRGGSLRLEHGPVGNVAVPFDKRRDRAASADHDVEELPDRVGDRAVMAVDQQKVALVVRLLGMPGEMDLAHMLERKIGEIGERGVAVIGGRDEDVVDVEQQAASGAPDKLADEIRLAHRRFREDDIGRRVLEQDRAADRLLHLVDVIGDARKRRLRVGQRQQIVEIGRVVGRPGEMLGNKRRLVAIDERLEAPEMRLVERLRPADRHAHAVERHRIVAADAGQRIMRRAAGAHVVFGMNLEEAVLLPLGEDRRQMLMLEAGAGEAGNGMRRKAEAPDAREAGRVANSFIVVSAFRQVACAYDGTSRVSGSGEPLRPPGSSIVAQVPPSTNFQALPW